MDVSYLNNNSLIISDLNQQSSIYTNKLDIHER